MKTRSLALVFSALALATSSFVARAADPTFTHATPITIFDNAAASQISRTYSFLKRDDVLRCGVRDIGHRNATFNDRYTRCDLLTSGFKVVSQEILRSLGIPLRNRAQDGEVL